jgi:multidrug efflux pump subunit AcrA (membrane-fusion protein)
MGYVPAVTDLPKILSNITDLSRGFLGASLSSLAASNTVKTPQLLPQLEATLADLPARKRRNMVVLTQRLPALLGETTQCVGVVALAVLGDRVRTAWVSDDRLKPLQGQLRAIYQNQLHTNRVPRRITLQSDQPQDFEAQLLLRQMEASSFDIVFPAQNAGYGLIVVDAIEGDHSETFAATMTVLQMSRPISTTPILTLPRKRALMGAAAVLALWLVWPAPTWLTVTGSSLPDATLAIALPSDATLQQMLVRVGQTVEKGAPIAQLFSAQLQERRSQEELSIKVEELAAQAAMSENNFGSFQLSKQRAEIAKTRLAQIVARIEQLNVTAPASGLIVSAVPDSTKGAALPQGTTLAEVQTSPKFLVRLNPARVDARLLEVGQAGKIYFRGLSDRTYDMRIITPPVATMDPNTRVETLEAYAQVTTEDDGRLMGGLSGYARIAAPRQMRILSLTRYVREYIRVTAWNYLGLPL